MDWKKITDTITPYIDKAKVYGEKAVVFTEDQIQMTPLFLKNQEEYDAFLTEKRSTLIAYDDTHEIARYIRLHSSIWIARAYMDAATIRFISINEYSDLARNMGLTAPLDMRVRFEGSEVFRLTTQDELEKWWKAPCYKKDDETAVSPNQPVDPLAKI